MGNGNTTVSRPENRNHIGSLRGMVAFYNDLIKQGKVLVGSAGYQRMVQLKNRLDKNRRFKKYGYRSKTDRTT